MKNIKRVFGLHFDFHAGNDTEIGENTKIEDIEKYILDTKPDFIQCDCKGHPGLTSYPTKVGTPAAKLKKDNLRIWADAAKKHDIPLFVHYSGVADAQYVKNHPDQAEVDINGDGYPGIVPTSVFGDYAEKLLIPQLKELITEYGIAGAWIDGEVWAVHRDISDHAKPYLWEGITPAEHGRVMREGFFRYVKKYTEELHRFDPDFKVISNWLYSSYVPEKPVLDVDYLSGDFQPTDSAHFVRLESRVLGVQGKRWDLMAWSFASPDAMDKSSVQLCQEAATVLSQGGGFQMYITQNVDGSPRHYEGDRLKAVADFVHKREMLYNKAPSAQIGILYSADSFYQENDCFNHAGATDKLTGALNVILDAGYTANIVLEWQLDEIQKYDVMVIPEWKFISDENKQKLINYAQAGGNLVVIGVECSRQFSLLSGDAGEILEVGQAFIRDHSGCYASIKKGKDETVKIYRFAEGEGELFSTWDDRYKIAPSYRTADMGEGKIAYIPFNLGSLYYNVRGFAYRNFIEEIVSLLCEKFVQTNRSIDVTMQTADAGVYLNLINMQQGRHSLKYETFDEIPPMYQVEVVINKEFNNVSSPLGEAFQWKSENGKTKIYLDKLDIHTVLLLENGEKEI